MKLFYNINPNILIESSIPKQKVVIDEIDALADTIDANMHKDVVVPKDVLDSFKIKDTLNPEIWEDDKLSPKVKTKLLQIAKDFFKDLEIPSNIKIKDVIFTGSLANFNWSKFSDIDLHIVLDFNDFDVDAKIIEDFFYAKKTIWNQEHDITVFKYPVELYVQDVNAKLVATAIYSVMNDEWVLKPKREKFKIDKKAIKDKATKIINQLKDIRDYYKQEDYQLVIDKTKSLKDKIKQMRSAGLEKGGEFSLENLVFKVLRRTPFMDQLDSFKSKAYDKLMSVTEIMKETIREKLKEARERIIPYSDKPELKQHQYTSLSTSAGEKEISNIKSKISKANEIIKDYDRQYDDNYFTNANIGDGFYQLEIKQDGRLLVKHIKASGDMEQRSGGFQPSDVGTCKTFQNIARYCVVKAGNKNLENGAFGKSPADDAANKALVIFQKQILDFLSLGDYTSDEKGVEISAQKMANNPKLERRKSRLDIQMNLGRPLLPSEWEKYLETGELPEKKTKQISIDQSSQDEFLARQKELADKIAKAKARQKLK